MSPTDPTFGELIARGQALVDSLEKLRLELIENLTPPPPAPDPIEPKGIEWTEDDGVWLQEHVQRWRQVILDPAGATDRDAARTAIATIYERAGLKAPVVLFCGSPHALNVTAELVEMRMQTHRRARRRHRSMRSPRHGLRPSRLRRAEMRATAADIPPAIWLEIVRNVRQGPTWTGGHAFGVGVRVPFGAFAHWKADAKSGREKARQRIHDAFDRPSSREEHPVFAEHLSLAALANRVSRPMLAPAAFYTFLGDFAESIHGDPVADVLERAGGPALEAQAMLAHAAGDVLLMERVAFVADRPTLIRLDEQDQLHSDTGPALAYPDGDEVFAVHGVRVPRAVLDGRVTVDMIDSEPNVEVRRVMMDRFGGVERFLSEAGAIEVHRDECGVLLERTFKVRSTDSRRVVAVRVTNSTPEPDGTFKDYVLQVPPRTRTAREGVAWTFGLEAKDYRPALQT